MKTRFFFPSQKEGRINLEGLNVSLFWQFWLFFITFYFLLNGTRDV